MGKQNLIDGMAGRWRDRASPARAAMRVVEDRITEGKAVRKVTRRALPRVVALLPRSRQEAARRYAAAVEAVEAPGGVNLEAAGGGGQFGEGPQFHAMRAVQWLERLEAEIGSGEVRLDARGRSISRRDLMRAVAVDHCSIADVANRCGVKPIGPRRAALSEAVAEDLGSLARLMGLE